jgi:FAD/FMN-containing dehydrogenase
MKVKSMDGGEIDLKQDIVDNLKLRLKGQVLISGDVGFEESRTVWNGMIDKKPAIVVRCLGTADIIACVQFVREHNLLLCIKGGGHNIAGFATAEGAVMLDMFLMRGVIVDPEKKVAHAQVGCLLYDVDRET